MWCLATSVLPAFPLSSFTSMGLYLFVIALPRQIFYILFPRHEFLVFRWREISLLLRFVFLVLCIWKCLQKETVVGISHASMMLTCHLLGKGCLSGFSLTSVLLLLCESWLRQVISSLSVEEPSLVKPFFEDLESECLMYFVFCESWYQIPESCPGYFVNRHKVFNLLLFQGEL